MKCPKCRLESPPSALRCDCGYDFKSQEMKESYVALEQQRRTGKAPQSSEEVKRSGQRDMVTGIVALTLGIFVTAVTYRNADMLGGTYVVARGAILWGFIWLVRGFDRSVTGIERSFWGKS